MTIPVGTHEDLLRRVHPDDLEDRRSALAQAINTHTELDQEYRTVWPTGRVVWLQSRGRAIYARDGTPLRFTGVSFDVTGRKESEARQLSLLDETELQRRSLERSNADLEQFAYVASHDLKAPLRAIAHLADWIGEDIEATASIETADNLKLLRGRVIRLHKLLDGLLAYSRVGRTDSPIEDVNIAEMVHDIASMIGPPRGFLIACQGDMPILRTHRAPIQLVLQNLISNGLQHHDRSEGRIVVSARIMEGTTEFRVSDDGPGIEPRFHERIFLIFQTLASRDEVESSGIGLAVVKRNVEGNGGRIWIESEPPERGTTVVFTWVEATRRKTRRLFMRLTRNP